MTNVLPFEQPIDPVDSVNPVDSAELEPEESFELEENFEPELLSLSMEGFEQPELPIANNLKQKVEAVLYLKGQPMNLAAIAEALGCEIEDAEMGLIDLITEYAHRDSALEIVETDVGFSLRLRSEFEDLVHKLIPVDLGRGVLRTLAAIALKKVRVDRVTRGRSLSACAGVGRAGICKKEKTSRWWAIVGFASNYQVSSIF
jgi:segregation and condensation protein B